MKKIDKNRILLFIKSIHESLDSIESLVINDVWNEGTLQDTEKVIAIQTSCIKNDAEDLLTMLDAKESDIHSFKTNIRLLNNLESARSRLNNIVDVLRNEDIRASVRDFNDHSNVLSLSLDIKGAYLGTVISDTCDFVEIGFEEYIEDSETGGRCKEYYKLPYTKYYDILNILRMERPKKTSDVPVSLQKYFRK